MEIIYIIGCQSVSYLYLFYCRKEELIAEFWSLFAGVNDFQQYNNSAYSKLLTCLLATDADLIVHDSTYSKLCKLFRTTIMLCH